MLQVAYLAMAETVMWINAIKEKVKKKEYVLVYYLWLKVNSRTIKSDVCICECINAYIGCMCGHTHKHRNMFHFRGF